MPTWAAEHDDMIRKGLASGFSYEVISRIVSAAGRPHTTRCAVGGRAHRIGIVAPPKLKNERHKVTRIRAIRHKPKPPAINSDRNCSVIAPSVSPVPMPPAHIWQALPGTTPVPFLDLTEKHCRWPLDNGTFCGCKKHPGSSYCETHHAIATSAPKVNPKPVEKYHNVPTGNAAIKAVEEFLEPV